MTGSSPGDAAGGGSPARREIDLAELLGDAREIVIRHAGSRYLLRLTRLNKLLLTKHQARGEQDHVRN